MAGGAGQVRRRAHRVGGREGGRPGVRGGRQCAGDIQEFSGTHAVRRIAVRPKVVAFEAKLVVLLDPRGAERGGERKQGCFHMAIRAAVRRHGVLARQRPGAGPRGPRLAPHRQQHQAQRQADRQPGQPAALGAQAALRLAGRHRAAAGAVGTRAGFAGGPERNQPGANPAVALFCRQALAGGAAFAFRARAVDARAALRRAPTGPLVLRTVVEFAVMDDALQQAAHGKITAGGRSAGRARGARPRGRAGRRSAGYAQRARA
jgi:hypothetical protein